MATNKKGFSLNFDSLKFLSAASDQDAGVLFKTIVNYAKGEQIEIESDKVAIMFAMVKDQLQPQKQRQTPSLTQTIEQRKKIFRATIAQHEHKYPKNSPEIQKFFEYWTEKSARGVKMRFEKEKTWEVSRRLKTWFDNAKKFSSKTNQFPKKITAKQALKDKLNL